MPPVPKSPVQDAVLSVRNLEVGFRTGDGELKAVKGVSLDVAKGETLAIVGESGSGKSQTMMAVMGLLASNGFARGSVKVGGDEILGLSPRELNRYRGSRMGMIFQEPMTSLDPLYKIGRQLEEPLRAHTKLSRAEARTRALEMLTLVGIPRPKERLNSYPHELSGGQRQRVMIAMALANRPEVLIADEPTTALDVTIQAQILELLADLKSRFGMSIVFITHDLGIVRRFADRVVVMKSGEVVETGETEAVFSAPRQAYTRMLLAAEPTGRRCPRRRARLCWWRLATCVSHSACGAISSGVVRPTCMQWTAWTSRFGGAAPSASSVNPDPASRRSAVRSFVWCRHRVRSASRTAT